MISKAYGSHTELHVSDAISKAQCICHEDKYVYGVHVRLQEITGVNKA